MCLCRGNKVVLLHRMIGQSTRDIVFVPFTEMHRIVTRMDQELQIAEPFFCTDLQISTVSLLKLLWLRREEEAQSACNIYSEVYRYKPC